MKASGIISAATLATAATAAPLVDGVVGTVGGVVGGLPIVNDILGAVPVTGLLDGVFARVSVDDLVSNLPTHDIVQQLPIAEIVQQLPVQAIASTVGEVTDINTDSLPVKRGLVDGTVASLPLVNGILDTIAVDDLLAGVLSILPVDGILQRLPVHAIVQSLPVGDIIARLPVDDVLADIHVDAKVNVNKRAAVDVAAEVPLVGAVLDRIPALDLVSALVSSLSVEDIVAQLPVKEIVAHLPVADIVQALPVAGGLVSRDVEQLDVAVVLQQTVVNVKKHTTVIGSTLDMVDNNAITVDAALTIVLKQVSDLKVVLVETVNVVVNDAALPLVKVEVEGLLAIVKTLVEDVLCAVVHILKTLGLRVKIVTLLHEVIGLVAQILGLVTGIVSGLVPGVIKLLDNVLASLKDDVVIPVALPLVLFVLNLGH